MPSIDPGTRRTDMGREQPEWWGRFLLCPACCELTMSSELVLLIDDDPTLRELLADHLQVAGYRVLAAADGNGGLRLTHEKQPNLVVLDLMMPGLDGWEVCKEVRAHAPTPIILLTAKSEEIDKLRGFRLGIDDYVTKPFSFAELTARIGAVLARTYRTP